MIRRSSDVTRTVYEGSVVLLKETSAWHPDHWDGAVPNDLERTVNRRLRAVGNRSWDTMHQYLEPR